MATLTIAGTISFPLGDEGTPPSRAFTAQLVYTERNIGDVVLVGAQADVDLMGLMTDAKACYIEVLEGEGDLKANGATEVLAVTTTAGFWIWFNPDGGLTALTVTTAADATFRVYMFA
jgi:hypothetical protein